MPFACETVTWTGLGSDSSSLLCSTSTQRLGAGIITLWLVKACLPAEHPMLARILAVGQKACAWVSRLPHHRVAGFQGQAPRERVETDSKPETQRDSEPETETDRDPRRRHAAVCSLVSEVAARPSATFCPTKQSRSPTQAQEEEYRLCPLQGAVRCWRHVTKSTAVQLGEKTQSHHVSEAFRKLQ